MSVQLKRKEAGCAPFGIIVAKKIISFNFLRAGIQNIFFIKQRQFVAEAKRTAF